METVYHKDSAIDYASAVIKGDDIQDSSAIVPISNKMNLTWMMDLALICLIAEIFVTLYLNTFMNVLLQLFRLSSFCWYLAYVCLSTSTGLWLDSFFGQPFLHLWLTLFGTAFQLMAYGRQAQPQIIPMQSMATSSFLLLLYPSFSSSKFWSPCCYVPNTILTKASRKK